MRPFTLPKSPEAFTNVAAFRDYAHRMVDMISDYYEALQKQELPVLPTVQKNYLREELPPQLPLESTNMETVLQHIQGPIMKGITHWQHPNFFAYFPCTTSLTALIGNMFAEAINQPGFTWSCCPASTELELIVMDWIVEAMNLPAEFMWKSGTAGGGTIQPSVTEAVLVSMIAAKGRIERQYSPSPLPLHRMVCYFSEQAHCCVEKAARVLSIPNIRKIGTVWDTEQENYVMDIAALRRAIERDLESGLLPFYLAGTFGTTGSAACDHLYELGCISKEYNLYFTIDAACCGVVAVCEEMRPWLRGVELADCFICNGAKLFGILFGTTFMFVSRRSDLVNCFNATGVYLESAQRAVDEPVNLKDYQLGLGRPFRSLKVFTSLMTMGRKGLQDHIHRQIGLAQHVDREMRLLHRADLFEVVTRTRFALVCFRIRLMDDQENIDFMHRLNAECNIFLVHTVIHGRVVLRLSINSPFQEAEQLTAIVDLICRMAHDDLNNKEKNNVF